MGKNRLGSSIDRASWVMNQSSDNKTRRLITTVIRGKRNRRRPAAPDDASPQCSDGSQRDITFASHQIDRTSIDQAPIDRASTNCAPLDGAPLSLAATHFAPINCERWAFDVDEREFLLSDRAVFLEIGFGKGEHLMARATTPKFENRGFENRGFENQEFESQETANQESASQEFESQEFESQELQNERSANFIGAELFPTGIETVLRLMRSSDEEFQNLRLFHGDARDLMAQLPSGSLAGIYLLFPDPWPKKRHWKRRMLNDVNLIEFARILSPGGFLRFATDIESYAEQAIEVASRSSSMSLRQSGNTATTAIDAGTPAVGSVSNEQSETKDLAQQNNNTPWSSHYATRYEARAKAEARQCHYFEFVKNSSD